MTMCNFISRIVIIVLINLICLVRPILTYNSEISFMDYYHRAKQLDLFPLFMKNIFSSSTSNVMYLLTFALYIYKSTVKLWCLELGWVE